MSAKLDPYQISAEYNVDPSFVIGIQKNFKGDGDVGVDFSKDMELLGGKLNFKASQTSGGDSRAGLNFRKTFEEGGEIGIPPGADLDPTQPSLTSPVLPNETIQPAGFVDNTPSADTVDTTQGFYSVNPAPNETIADFEARTASQFQTQVADSSFTDEGSFRPPEGYVSPRISNPFMGGSGEGSTLDYTDTSGDGTDTGGSGGNLSSGDVQDLGIIGTVLGTLDDVAASGAFDRTSVQGLNTDATAAALDEYTKSFFNPDDFSEAEFYKSLWTTATIDASGIETTGTDWFQKYIYDDTFASNTDIKLNELLGNGYKDINEYAAANGDEAARALLNEAITWTSIDETIQTIKTIELDTTFKFGSSNNVGLLRNKDGSLMRYDATEGTIGGALIGAGGDTEFLYNEDGSIKE